MVNTLLYKLPNQKDNEMKYKFSITDLYKDVTGNEWLDLPKIKNSENIKTTSEKLQLEKTNQMGKLLTKQFELEEKGKKDPQLKTKLLDHDEAKKMLLEIAKNEVEPIGNDKKLIVRLSTAISGDLKKASGEIIRVEQDKKRPSPEEGSKCCMLGTMITGKVKYSDYPNGTWQQMQGIVLNVEEGKKGLKGYREGIGWVENGGCEKCEPHWLRWDDTMGFRPTSTPATRTLFKKWWNYQLKHHKKKLLKLLRDNNIDRDKLPKPYKEDEYGPKPFFLKGGKKKSNKNIKMRRTRKRKGGSKTLTSLQKAKIINVMNDKKIQQYVREKTHRVLTLKKKLGGPRKFRSFTRKRKRKRKKTKKSNTGKRSRRRKRRRRKYTCRKRKNCK